MARQATTLAERGVSHNSHGWITSVEYAIMRWLIGQCQIGSERVFRAQHKRFPGRHLARPAARIAAFAMLLGGLMAASSTAAQEIASYQDTPPRECEAHCQGKWVLKCRYVFYWRKAFHHPSVCVLWGTAKPNWCNLMRRSGSVNFIWYKPYGRWLKKSDFTNLDRCGITAIKAAKKDKSGPDAAGSVEAEREKNFRNKPDFWPCAHSVLRFDTKTPRSHYKRPHMGSHGLVRVFSGVYCLEDRAMVLEVVSGNLLREYHWVGGRRKALFECRLDRKARMDPRLRLGKWYKVGETPTDRSDQCQFGLHRAHE